MQVSIPSRGFWFFEDIEEAAAEFGEVLSFQSPRGDFGFLKAREVVVGERQR